MIAVLVAAVCLCGSGPTTGPYEPAERGEVVQLQQPPPAPEPLGLWDQPFAPEHLTGCDEMAWYRAQWGLPARFDGIGYRESRCRNVEHVRTFCCHGYWQMYTSLHVRDHRLTGRMALCDVHSHHDLNSDTSIEKQRNACATKMLFDVVGLSAWSATR